MKFFTALIGLWLSATSLFGQSPPDVHSVEYFIDTDPGFGLGTSVAPSAATSGSDKTFVFSVSTTGLPSGFHTLYVRSRDNNGGWSQATAKAFYVMPGESGSFATAVQRVEYFIDTDPGFGNGIAMGSPSSGDATVTGMIDISALPGGFHTLYVRARDGFHKWSVLNSRTFYKSVVYTPPTDPQVTYIEYFVDKDPGYGNGTSVPGFTASSDITHNFLVDIGALSGGFHTLYIRTKDANGNWSIASTKAFYKPHNYVAPSDPQITAMEYFIDTDPGFGAGTALSFTASSDVTVNGVVDITSVSGGFHTLYLRSKDANGNWSVAQAHAFYKAHTVSNTSSNITAIEYNFYKSGSSTPVRTFTAFTPSTDVQTTFLADLSGLNIDSTYDMRVTAIDAAGRRSIAATASTVIIERPNHAPEIKSSVADVTANEDFDSLIVASLDTVFHDSDMTTVGDHLQFNASVNGSAVTSVLRGSQLVIFSSPDIFGSAEVIITATDDSSASVSDTIHVTVNSVNDRPLATYDVAQANAGYTAYVQPLKNDTDIDGDALVIAAIVTMPQHGTATVVSPADTLISYTPTVSYSGIDSIQYAVSDGLGGLDTAIIYLQINGYINSAPQRNNTIADVTASEDFGVIALAPLNSVFGDNDMALNNDSLRYSVSVQPAIVALSLRHDTVVVNSIANLFGIAEVIVTATDDSGATASDTLTVTVNSVNDAPFTQNDAVSTTGIQTVVAHPLNNDTDVESQTLTIAAIITSPQHGSATIPSGDTTIAYTATIGYSGNDSLTYSVSDGNGGLDTAKLVITIQAPAPLSLSTSVHQNPALAQYADVYVIADTALIGLPDVKMFLGSDSTALTMTVSTSRVYRGQFEFASSGAYTIRTRATAATGAQAVNFRSFTATLAKPGVTTNIASTDAQAQLLVKSKAIVSPTYITVATDESMNGKAYQFAPALTLQEPSEITIRFEPSQYEDAGKIFIESETDGRIVRLQTGVYPEQRIAKAKITSLGKVRIVYDPSFTGSNTVPTNFSLKANYPNPFNPSTTIAYDLAKEGLVTLTVYNVLGQKVKTLVHGHAPAGSYKLLWDATDERGKRVSTGVYFYRLETPGFVQTRKMLLMK
ncbi:MAG TPA: tandem-95 repeat protein [bacterium]|nr:tandem-95 repeat protein [bacterium]